MSEKDIAEKQRDDRAIRNHKDLEAFKMKWYPMHGVEDIQL